MDDNTEEEMEGSHTHNLFTRILTACGSFLSIRKTPESRQKADPSSKGSPLNQNQPETQPKAIPKVKMLNPNDRQRRGLREVIDDDTFWEMDEMELLHLIKAEYPEELERLKGATFVRNPNASRPEGPSISESLYGQEYAEVNRTLVGVLALRWLHNDEYETFIGTQGPAPIVLKRESFEWLRRLFERGLRSTEDTFTLITSMVINDLGKDPHLASDYAKLKGIDISRVNHDMILYHAVEAGMVPALRRLTQENRDNLLMGIKLGSSFNFGQLAQAENAPASLAGLLEMRGRDRAFEMRFMEQILDLSGASGHEDWTCAKKMIEPIFQSYNNVYDVAHAIISGGMNLRQGYDIILVRKLKLLHDAGYMREFDINKPADRALMRLFSLGNTTYTQNADIFFFAFTERISTEIRDKLIYGLNVEGSIHEPAVQPTYTPAMLTKATGNTVRGSQEEKINAIAAMLRYLARCLVVEPASLQKLKKGVTVIERDVRKIIPVLDSEEFKKNPDILDREDIPEDQVANLAPGY
ncbi:uncharacterized protein Z518_05793 [Rhinocladiella mackenziei CBS 650.93]|uniref:Uncharacterized protein n=1 Tax=Rhinocladiella mackenziei CBS 650.93 TaxID=1442369 RepID=A0A0D2FRZ1_9EURO|nr:uncharacterized protein Z518_05793 [Rhinocladiella mackenziei CBS 650.93]KIX04922.1 hypothetical protein Z518_05793 [Rhinocladiella mackenziei CBS 650.93]